ncbi:sigma factor [Streptosporangium sandarakinum]|uniref:sigma factor n=1 Tax=Streptosporangium sandarakinum TaxID=1260955 RepID=UPI0036D133E4
MSFSGTTPEPKTEAPPRAERPARDRVDVAGLFAEHHLGLVRLALLMVGDQATAEDVVQEAFARTHAGRRRLRDPGRALTYVRSAVLNGARSVLRRRAVAFRRAAPYEPPVWSAEHAALLGEERREDMPEAFRLRIKPGTDSLALTRAVSGLPGVSNAFDTRCGLERISPWGGDQEHAPVGGRPAAVLLPRLHPSGRGVTARPG